MNENLRSEFMYLLFIAFNIFIFSCNDNESGVLSSVKLHASATEILANGKEVVTFKVVNQNGMDISPSAKLFKDGTAFSGLSFSSSIAIANQFYAEWDGFKSNIVTVVVKPVIRHSKNILIEDYSGTWCGYCTRASKAIEEILKINSKIDVVVIHNDNEMMFSDLKTLTNAFNINEYPTSYIDRSYKWAFPENENGLQQALRKPALCGISIDSEVANTTGQIKINVEFAGGYVSRTKLVVYVTENNLLFNQVNFYSQYGSNPIVNFRHDFVLRIAITPALGDDIPVTGPAGFSKDYQFDTGKYKKENLNIVAFVTDAVSGESLNSKTVKLGTKGFNSNLSN